MLVLAVIPARLHSTRLLRKPLQLLGGVPLVVRVYERVVALGVADHCIVATDAAEVIDACARYRVPTMLTSTSHPSGTDRVAEVARCPEFVRYSIFLNVQGDEPFVSAAALNGAVNVVRSGFASIGTAATSASAEILQRPNVVKVVRAHDGRALYFSRAAIPFLRDHAESALLNRMVFQHVGVYAYTAAALAAWVALPPHPLEQIEHLEQLRPLAHGMSIGIADVDSVDGGIDTEEDLVHANVRWMQITAMHAPAASHTLTMRNA